MLQPAKIAPPKPRSRLRRALLAASVGVAALVGSAHAQDAINLSIWTAYGKQLQPAMDAYNAKMAAEGKNITVSATELGTESIADKFAVAATTGDVPDILDLDLVLAPKFVQLGAITDITDKVEAAGFAGDFNAKFLDLGVMDGRTYMIPFNADVSALFYNKAIFTAAGLDPENPPKTWDEFSAALQAIADAKLTAPDGQPVYAFAATNDPGQKMFCDMPFVWTNGGNWLNDAGEVILDSAESKEAIEWLAGIETNAALTPPNPSAYGWDQKMNDFYAGHVAVMCSSSYVIAEISEKAPDIDYGVFLFPSPDGTNPSSFIGGDVIGIPTGSKHPDEAWDFIQYAMGAEVQIDVWAKAGMPTVRESMASNAYFDKDARYYVFSDGVKYGQVPKTIYYNDLYEPWGTAWSEILAGGGRPVPEILDEAATSMRDIVNQ